MNIPQQHYAHPKRTAPRSTMAILLTSSFRLKMVEEFTWLGTTYTASANDHSSLARQHTTHAYRARIAAYRDGPASTSNSRVLLETLNACTASRCKGNINVRRVGGGAVAFTQGFQLCSRTY